MNTHICVRTHNWRCVSCIFIFHHFYMRWCECARNFTLCIFTPVARVRATLFLTHYLRFPLLLLSSFYSLSRFKKKTVLSQLLRLFIRLIMRSFSTHIGSSCSTSCCPYRTKVEHFRRIQSVWRWKSFDNSTNRSTAKSGASPIPGLQSK